MSKSCGCQRGFLCMAVELHLRLPIINSAGRSFQSQESPTGERGKYVKVLLKRFHLNGHTLEFCLYTPKLKLHTKQIVPSESAAKEVFYLNVTPQDFIQRRISQNYIINKQYHVKVLLKRFYLNGNTIGFHPQTQKLELHTK